MHLWKWFIGIQHRLLLFGFSCCSCYCPQAGQNCTNWSSSEECSSLIIVGLSKCYRTVIVNNDSCHPKWVSWNESVDVSQPKWVSLSKSVEMSQPKCLSRYSPAAGFSPRCVSGYNWVSWSELADVNQSKWVCRNESVEVTLPKRVSRSHSAETSQSAEASQATWVCSGLIHALGPIRAANLSHLVITTSDTLYSKDYRICSYNGQGRGWFVVVGEVPLSKTNLNRGLSPR